jgi:branched-subunit amino acid ABC-type transport system permease component
MERLPLTSAQKLNAIGLALFGLSIPLQIGMGITAYPTIPPGIFVTLGAAALIVFGRWRWTVYLGFGLPVVLLVGTILSNWIPRLLDPSSIGYIGVVLQMLGLAIALVAGAKALFEKQSLKR